MDEFTARRWRTRIKKRRGKAFHPGSIRELNLVAMMDMLTVVVVFLLKSYSVSAMSIPVGAEINVPQSKNIVNPQEAIKLTVTKATDEITGVIAIDNNRIYELTPKQVAMFEKMAREKKYLLPKLHEELSQAAARAKKVGEVSEQYKFEGQILVIADKATPYWLITQILFTAANADFDQYNLVAMKEQQ